MKSIRPLLLLIAAVSFGLGISLPLMRFEKLFFFAETPSLLDIVTGLWGDGETWLALVVVIFSIVFPLVKLVAVFQATLSGKALGGWTAALAKWSMMDVLLVAILVFAAKTSGLAGAFTQPGLWFFALSAVATALSSHGLSRR